MPLLNWNPHNRYKDVPDLPTEPDPEFERLLDTFKIRNATEAAAALERMRTAENSADVDKLIAALNEIEDLVAFAKRLGMR